MTRLLVRNKQKLLARLFDLLKMEIDFFLLSNFQIQNYYQLGWIDIYLRFTIILI